MRENPLHNELKHELECFYGDSSYPELQEHLEELLTFKYEDQRFRYARL